MNTFHGIRKAPSTARSGRGNVGVQGVGQLHDGFFNGPCRLPWRVYAAVMMVSSPGKSYCRAAAHFHFNEFEQLGVVTMSHLFRNTMMYGTPT
jgi:hypothetical protein